MSFSYNPANLATEDKDGVRFFLGDTDSLSPLLQDEEIVYALSQRGNRYGATGMCARALAAQFSRLVSTSADGVSAQLNQKSQQFLKLAQEYEVKAARLYSTPTCGGISVADGQAVAANTDRVPDIFVIGQNDNVGTTPNPTGLNSNNPAWP